MPLYEYQCARCGRFEVIRKFSDTPLLTCPTCGGEVQKLLSAPAIQFKGTGWYITDYARKSSGQEGSGKSGEAKGGEGGKGEASAASATKDGGSSSKDSGSSSSDTGAKAAASSESAPAKGGSGGRGAK